MPNTNTLYHISILPVKEKGDTHIFHTINKITERFRGRGHLLVLGAAVVVAVDNGLIADKIMEIGKYRHIKFPTYIHK